MTSSEKCIVKNDDGYVDEEKTANAIASALSEARKRERERVREKITELFPKHRAEDVPPNLFEFNEGIDYTRDRILAAIDSLSEPKL